MTLHIDAELQEEQLLVTARGSLEFDAALRLLEQVCATAKDKGVNKILVNGLALEGELSRVDRYRLGVLAVQKPACHWLLRLSIKAVGPALNYK